MSSRGTIVLPIAGRSSRFPGLRPKWMLAAPTGELMLEKSLQTIADWKEHRIVIGALREHLEDQKGLIALQRALGDRAEIISFDLQTSGPAETVAQILRRAEVRGPFFIKDCDSWFVPDGNVFANCVCYGDLHKLPDVRNVAAKSFVHLNENRLVVSVVEKLVSSSYISVGGYGFDDEQTYLSAYAALLADPFAGEPFVSHVIVEAMRAGAVFRGVETSGYQDVGTLAAWNRFRQRQSVFIVDIDGVVLRNAGQYIPPLWDDPDVPLEENIAALRQLQSEGAQLVFITARPERYREKTEAVLRQAGLSWHAIVFGVHHAGRTLINDYAPSNPYPSATAINLVRNEQILRSLIPPAAE